KAEVATPPPCPVTRTSAPADVTAEPASVTITPRLPSPEDGPPVPLTVSVPAVPPLTRPPLSTSTPYWLGPGAPPRPSAETTPAPVLCTVPLSTWTPTKEPVVGAACWLADSVRLPLTVETVAPV